MLTKWGLTNFKSIYHADLDLAPLTVLTGTNSSGKSSLIQSILMLAQTMQNPFCENNTLMLNGPLVKLGLPESIQSFSPEKDGSETDKTALGIRWAYRAFTEEEMFRVSGVLFDSFDDDVLGPPEWTNIDELVTGYPFPYKLRTKTDKKYIRWDSVKTEVLFDRDEKFGYFLKEIGYELDYTVSDSQLKINNLNILTEQRHAEMKAKKKKEGYTMGEDSIKNRENALFLIKEVKPRIPVEKGKKSLEVSISDFIPRQFFGTPDNCPWESKDVPTEYAVLNHDIKDCFSRVKYLGPLRFQGPLYEFSGSSNKIDVGYDGRYTASVIHILYNQENRVLCYEKRGDEVGVSGVSGLPFHEYLDMWLRNLGVAEGVKVTPTKHGYEIQAIIKSGGVEQEVDINHVGTGLSHVLPVVVMGLVSSPGSFLIFDQPEMYLHPRVQSRLADFFIEMALSGRQCIIETHSEYFISQLRYRISKALMKNEKEMPEKEPLFLKDLPKTGIPELVKIYFASKKDGKSEFKEIKVTKYGGLSE
ncbi:MAG: AAA family ATPase, partial [Spirochaetaceae bacterium]|nr:AAA family ATPase [Spirochaetaceae bacterium]